MNFSKVFGASVISLVSLSGCVFNQAQEESQVYDGYGYYGDNGNPSPTDAYDPGVYASEAGDVVSYDSPSATAPIGAFDQPAAPSTYHTSNSAAAGGRTYTVQRGDNLYRIGKTYGVAMQAIINANGLGSTTIHPGQQLIIP